MSSPIPWSEDTPESWGAELAAHPWEEDRDGDRIRGWSLVAPCPLCGHADAIELYFARSVITGFRNDRLNKILRRKAAEREAGPITVDRPVECDCGKPHPGRPPGGVGCGRSDDVTFLIGGA